MHNRVILVLIDGLNYGTALSCMGYLQHLVEQEVAQLYQVKTELPTSSRPLYETILTGTPPHIHGIVNNKMARLSREESLFSLARANGLTTAAAAYYWISELYNRAPFDPVRDREQSDTTLTIQQGKFYFDDAYPDSHLFYDGEILRIKYNPDFLLIHPMGMDYAGHLYGSNSREYNQRAIETDGLLAMLIPRWLEEDYQVIITSDHGMTSQAIHGGTGEEERIVPLWTLGSSFKKVTPRGQVPQLGIAPAICKLLNIPPTKKMIDYRFPGQTFCE
ncbi:alkaline phosphatase family protein [Desulfotomaculum nigrificans]|uniref:alkaline phosphatase family protein n=1 Tax=Desulfotomaculum nigrificans TaxID=1565 RepID=UPI0001FAE81F|nr:alkaline phosphatase family protein [Desulfotomaculum nigrificans]